MNKLQHLKLLTHRGHFLIGCALVLLVNSCTYSTRQNVDVTDVSTHFVHDFDPNTVPNHYNIIGVVISLSGSIPGEFTLSYGPRPSKNNEQPIRMKKHFDSLDRVQQIETEWYGDVLRVEYQPNDQIESGHLSISAIFHAVR